MKTEMTLSELRFPEFTQEDIKQVKTFCRQMGYGSEFDLVKRQAKIYYKTKMMHVVKISNGTSSTLLACKLRVDVVNGKKVYRLFWCQNIKKAIHEMNSARRIFFKDPLELPETNCVNMMFRAAFGITYFSLPMFTEFKSR